jgi:hypothetical protein
MGVDLNKRADLGRMLSIEEVDENWSDIEGAIDAMAAIQELAFNADATLKKPPILKGVSSTGTQAYFTALQVQPTTYDDLIGYLILLKPDFTNTSSAATLRVAQITTGGGDGSGNVPIRKNQDKLLEAGDIRAGKWSIFFTDGTTFVLLNPASATKGNYDGTVPNGSFEVDSDNDGKPDEWTVPLLYPGGSFAFETSDVGHGARAVKFTHPGGAGNGGGLLLSAFMECSEKRAVMLQWLHKSSVAGMKNRIELLWYDKAKVLVGGTTIYSSTANPTSWTVQTGVAMPLTNARYFTIRIIAGETDVSTGGTSYWDDVRLVEAPTTFEHEYVFEGESADRTVKWVCPTGVKLCYVEVEGGGGGGAAGDDQGGNGAAGGGSGAYAAKYLTPTEGNTYTLQIGKLGAGGTASQQSGTAGGTSSISGTGITTLQATGGGAGTYSQVSGGAAGTASGGDVNINGSAGAAGSGNDGGAGGRNTRTGWAGGIAGLNVTPKPGGDGSGFSAGGGGGAQGEGTGNFRGGDGAPGRVRIRWTNVA